MLYEQDILTFISELLACAIFNRQTSMARRLLQEKLDVDHVNGFGGTPLFYLYHPQNAAANRSAPSMSVEILNMLACYGFSNANAPTDDGWASLHRAAAFGSPEDIRALVELGADITMRTYRHSWTPMAVSVRFKNPPTFFYLADLYDDPDSLAIDVDSRGWTLLHLAVFSECFEVIPYLLSHGADPHILTLPEYKLIDDDLEGQVLTPGDIARYRGPEAAEKYHQLLKDAGYHVDLDEEDDIFWEYKDDSPLTVS